MSQARNELWEHRELFWFFVWRDVKVRYKQTALGAAWAVLQPLMTSIVFLMIGRMASLPTEGLPPLVFWFAALVPWTYFANAFQGAGQSLISNSQLLTKVWFPRVTLPAAPVIAGLLDFAIATVVLLGLLVFHGVLPSPWILLWPMLTLLTAATALGFGLLAAAWNVKYRDVKYALPFLVQFWMFASPVLWSWDQVRMQSPDWLRIMLHFNPMCGIIDGFRGSLMGGAHIDWVALASSTGVSAIVLLVGLTHFHRAERAFADLI